MEVDPEVEVDDAPGVEVDEELPGVEVDGEDDAGVVTEVDDDSEAVDELEVGDDEDVAVPATASGASTRGSSGASLAAHAAPTTTRAAVIAVKRPSNFLILFLLLRVWGTSVRHGALWCPQEKVKKKSRAASGA